MTTDFDTAAKLMEEAEQRLSKNMQNMFLRETALADLTKKVGGQVRKAGNDLAEGLAKVEKAANFDRLERYVALLERAAQAMQTLADLENSGKLERIAAAIK